MTQLPSHLKTQRKDPHAGGGGGGQVMVANIGRGEHDIKRGRYTAWKKKLNNVSKTNSDSAIVLKECQRTGPCPNTTDCSLYYQRTGLCPKTTIAQINNALKNRVWFCRELSYPQHITSKRLMRKRNLAQYYRLFQTSNHNYCTCLSSYAWKLKYIYKNLIFFLKERQSLATLLLH